MFSLLGKRKEITVKVIISVYIEEDEGVFYAYSPTMPGLHVEGETEEIVKKNVEEAAVAYLASLIKHDDPLPLGTIIYEAPEHAKKYSFTHNIPAYA